MRIHRDRQLVGVLSDNFNLSHAKEPFKQFWAQLERRGVQTWQRSGEDKDVWRWVKPSPKIKGIVIAEIEEAGFEVDE